VVAYLKGDKLLNEEIKEDFRLRTQMTAYKMISKTGWAVQAECKKTGQMKLNIEERDVGRHKSRWIER
jgi:hypothetical protein